MQNDTLENGNATPEEPSDKAPELTDSKAAVPAEEQEVSPVATAQDQKASGSKDAVAQAKEKAKEGLNKAKDWADNNEAIAKAKAKGKEGLNKAKEGLNKAKDWADNNEAIAKAKEKGKEGLHKAEEGLHKAKDWVDNNETIAKVKTKVKDTFHAFAAWTDSNPKVSQAKQKAKTAVLRANSWLLAKHISTRIQIVIGVAAVFIILLLLNVLSSLDFYQPHKYEPKITPPSLFAYTKEKDDTLGEYAEIKGIIKKKGHALVTYDVLEFPSKLGGLPVKKITIEPIYSTLNKNNEMDLYVNEELTKGPVECYSSLYDAIGIVIPEGVESFEGMIRTTYLERLELPSTLKTLKVHDGYSKLDIDIDYQTRDTKTEFLVYKPYQVGGGGKLDVPYEKRDNTEYVSLDLSSKSLKEIVVKCKVHHIQVGSCNLEKLVLPEDLYELIINPTHNAMLENEFMVPPHLKHLKVLGTMKGLRFSEELEAISLRNSPKELTLPSNKRLRFVEADCETLNLPNLEYLSLEILPDNVKALNCPKVKTFNLSKTDFKPEEYEHYIIGKDGHGNLFEHPFFTNPNEELKRASIPDFLQNITLNGVNMARIYYKRKPRY